MTRRYPDSPLLEELDELEKLSNDAFSDRNYEESICYLLAAWGKLPDPKGAYSQSFHYCNELALTYMHLNNTEQAQKWSQEIYHCDLFRPDSGERAFLSGKVAYAMQNLNAARTYFSIANKKSGGRLLKHAGQRYKDLIDPANREPADFMWNTVGYIADVMRANISGNRKRSRSRDVNHPEFFETKIEFA